jgi:hypothetical protein
VYALKARPFHWICKAKTCGVRNGYRFSVLTKTIVENTNYPLKTWVQVIYLMLQSKNGISALQIQRIIGSGAYKTAWHMCHRIRAAMKDGGSAKLMEEVEIDETVIGGRKSTTMPTSGNIFQERVEIRHDRRDRSQGQRGLLNDRSG